MFREAGAKHSTFWMELHHKVTATSVRVYGNLVFQIKRSFNDRRILPVSLEPQVSITQQDTWAFPDTSDLSPRRLVDCANLDAVLWWDEASLDAMGFVKGLNPFDVNADHPAAKLSLTRRGYKDWINRLGVDAVAKGKHLAQIWKQVVLRRTHSSCIPLTGGRIIGESVPRVKAAIINCTHTPAEHTRYIPCHEKEKQSAHSILHVSLYIIHI